ncbi:hypothetical protein BKA62DRAFT_686779 [Auriculariales sp. MPI-PUGE-AT-0066]|nr:hypothetical protein BKA62DRAFT_686779 [Auriculariales sp. MPI-PUGE-AT-0066]
MSTRPSTPFTHQLRQLRFIAIGSAGMWWTSAFSRMVKVFWYSRGDKSVPMSAKFTSAWSIFVGLAVVAQFLFLIWTPFTRNVQLDYRNWRASPELRGSITVLTVSLVFGWSLLVYTLCKGTSLDLFRSIVGASSWYIIGAGLLGLIPVPRRIPE